MIEFPLYNAGSNKPQTYQIAILIISVLSIYFLLPINKINITLIIILGFVIYIVFIDKRKKVKGKLFLTDHQIKVITEVDDIEINLSDIERLELIYSGYKGKRIRGDLIPRFNTFSGTDNYVTIVDDKHEYNYKFFVANALEENNLIELVQNWDRNGYNTSNIKINK